MRLTVVILFFSLITLIHGETLFNGKDLAGWHHEGPRHSFFAAGGELRTSGRAHSGNWLRSEREYENFRLTFEYKLAQWAEAAVILRAPRTERPQHAGLTIMLAHDFHNKLSKHVTGALMGLAAPSSLLPPDWGKWHKAAIDLQGDRLKLSIDGVELQDVRVPDSRLRRGYIGFPDMGHGYAVRNIEIEDLGSPTQFTSLIRDGSVKGWDLRGGGNWQAGRDTIEASNGHGILYAPGTFGDFELTAVVRSHARTNSGVFLRGDATGPRRGFEVQIYSPVDSVFPTGSIYGLVRSRISADFEERWFLLQVRVIGATCRVWLDGELAAETDELPADARKPGRIGLQIHMEDTRVEFRDLRVRELQPQAQ
ncbi:MAG: DUF1080 domain-containing protein [Bryobacterales bacterium]|nr:DUF1080 domain-containing protein [Bryobacterales bacterium]